jgi:TorA maturation chaperone TorD
LIGGYERMQQPISEIFPVHAISEIDRARAREYALLATLLARSPDTQLITRLAVLRGDASPLGMAHAALGEAAGRTNEESAGREFFDLFVGLGQGQLSPYASHYLTGSLYSRPLARLREALEHLGIERTQRSEPEDHIAILCEIMAGLSDGSLVSANNVDRDFFQQHLATWGRRFFVDLEQAESADFYRSVGSFGRTLMEIETEVYSLPV